MSVLNTVDKKTEYIEEQLVKKNIIKPFNNLEESEDEIFKISNVILPNNGYALVWNDTSKEYEPQNITGEGSPLTNTNPPEGGSVILKGNSEIKRLRAENTSLIKIINDVDKIDFSLNQVSTSNILLLGYTPPLGLKEPVVVSLNNTHFNTTSNILELNTINTNLIANGAITPAKLSNIGNVKILLTNGTGAYIAVGYNNPPLSLYNNNLGVRYTRTITSNNTPTTTLNFSSSRFIIVNSSTAFNHTYSINTAFFADTAIFSNNETFEFQVLINNTNAFDSPLFSFTHAQSLTSIRLGIPGDNCWDGNSQFVVPLKSKLYKFSYINNTGGTVYLINSNIIDLTQ